jgi:DNA-binding NarL/FixJ family response regulator
LEESIMSDKAKVLVIDDEPIVCLSCEKVLSSEGHSVQSAYTGEEAMAKLNLAAYDLVITDLKIPDQNGLVLLKTIKADHPDTDVVMITGYPSVDTAREAMKLGASDYIPKPLTPDIITELVSKSLSRRSFTIVEETVEEAQESAEMPAVEHHESGSWLTRTEDGQALLGFTPGAWLRSGQLVYIELPSEGEKVERGKVFARVLTGEGKIHELLSPVDGIVVEVNEQANDDLIASSREPEKSEWLMKLVAVEESQ